MRKIAIALACLIALPAAGQDRGAGARIRLPIPLPNPLAPASSTTAPSEGALGQALAQALSKPFLDIANLINSDLDGAIKLSTAIPSLQDGNGQQCWMAMQSFGAVVKAHPLPLTGKAVTDLEAARLMAMAANKLCANPNCTQVFADLANAVQQVNSVSIIPGAGAIQIPSLNSLCAHVPVVVVAPPASTPPAVAAPTPAATPANP